MIELIKVELKKLFKKGTLWAFLVISVIMIVGEAFAYKYITYKEPIYSTVMLEKEIDELNDANNKLDLTKEELLLEYLNNTIQIEVLNLKKTYASSEQNQIIDEFFVEDITNYYTAMLITKDAQEQRTFRNNLDILENKLKDKDYDYFTNLKIKELEKSTNELDKKLLELEKYRLEHHISYDTNDYLNEALNNIKEAYIASMQTTDEKKLEELNQTILENQYILDNKMDLNNYYTAYQFIAFTMKYSINLLIVLFIIFGGASLVSDEFSKGTIKSLLTKPFTRNEILLSKLIAYFIYIIFIVFFLEIVYILGYGLSFGFTSLSWPVLLYKANNLYTHNLLYYTFISTILAFPKYIIIGLVAVLFSVTTLSTLSSMTFSCIMLAISTFIETAENLYKNVIMKYFIGYHWDLSYLASFAASDYEFKLSFSIIVILCYLLILLYAIFKIFRKIDVKNV